jgi:xanthine dehydrogenase YagT iron-sulfur-binding subunit
VTSVVFKVNGRVVEADLDTRESLLDVLRERLELTGAKKGWDKGQCGACTVHLDGRRVVSCLTLAVQAGSRDVTTIEGLAAPDGMLHAPGIDGRRRPGHHQRDLPRHRAPAP